MLKPFFIIFLCNIIFLIKENDGATIQEQLEHLARRRQESLGQVDMFTRRKAHDPRMERFYNVPESAEGRMHRKYYNHHDDEEYPDRDGQNFRRSFFRYDPNDVGTIIGAPSLPSHLPEAEPILPGHTLLRPAMGMLKSSLKFPHRELEDGAGVYGNIKNLGLKYDGKNERVLYSGFRRNAPTTRRKYSEYIMVVPDKKPGKKKSKSRFTLTNLVLDLDRKENTKSTILDTLDTMKKPTDDNKLILYIADPKSNTLYLTDLLRDDNNDQKSQEPWEHGGRPRLSDALIRIIPLIDISSIETKSSENELRMFRRYIINFNSTEAKHWFIEAEAKMDDFFRDLGRRPMHAARRDITVNIFNDLNPREEVGNRTLTKMEKLLNTRDQFLNVKIQHLAVELKDLNPDADNPTPLKENARQWWYFNELDFKPFEGENEK